MTSQQNNILPKTLKGNGKVNKGKALLKVSKALTKVKKEAITNESKAIKGFATYLNSEWIKLASKVLKDSKSISQTEKGVESFLKETDSTMEKFADNVEKEMTDYIAFLYKYSKQKFLKDNKKVKKASIPTISPSIWLKRDQEAINAIDKITKSSTGKFYKSSVQKAVHESVKKNTLESSLSSEEAGEVMRSDLAKALKVKEGSLDSQVVPEGFQGTSQEYFTGLAENTGTMSRTVSTVYAVEDVGAKYVVIRSIRAANTCIGCLEMDGTTHKVRDAVQHVEEILDMDDVSEYGDIQPSFHFHNKENASQSEEDLLEEIMNDGNLYLPPFHFNCQCYVDMED